MDEAEFRRAFNLDAFDLNNTLAYTDFVLDDPIHGAAIKNLFAAFGHHPCFVHRISGQASSFALGDDFLLPR